MAKEIIVVSVGGSLIVPDEVDVRFLKSLKTLVEKQIRKGKKFVIITGGGKTSRKYQDAAKTVAPLSSVDLDWLGIHTTRLNAQLVRTVLRNHAEEVVIKNPTSKIWMRKPVLVTAGWKPGYSTDYDAVMIARSLRAKKMVNLSDIDYVYDKNPKKYKNAKPLKTLSWKELRKVIPKKWSPGTHSPLDPIAAREGEKIGLEVAMLNGKHMKRFENYLNGKRTIGTIIS